MDLANMSQADVIAYLRSLYGSEQAATLGAAPLTGWNQYTPGGADEGMWRPDGGTDANYSGRWLTPDAAYGGQDGAYVGAYDQGGQLADVFFDPKEKYGFADQWGGPLTIAAAAIGGGMLNNYLNPEMIAGGIGSDVALGGASTDLLGGAALPEGLGSGTFGLGAGEATLPTLTAGGESLFGAALPSASAIGAATAGTAGAAGLGGILGTIGEVGAAVKPWAPVIGAAAGALASGTTQGGTATGAKEPWGPAQDWLIANIAAGQKLQQQYQEQPFNQVQQRGYQNLLDTIGSFRSQTAPALMDFANSAMGRTYQPAQMPQMPASGSATGPVFSAPGGLLQPPAQVFSAPSGGSYGLLDWAALNPFRR